MTPTMQVQIQPHTNATIDIPTEYIDAFLELLELRTEETVAHSKRVAALAEELAENVGLAPGWISEVIRPAALLHDLGKVAFSDRLLEARGVRPADQPLIEAHPVFAERVLKSVPAFQPLLPIVRHVHERWEREAFQRCRLDGDGYPDGLSGEAIPLAARLIAVVDAFDAITHDRARQPAKSEVEALHRLRHCAGTQFDPMLVYRFCQHRGAAQRA